MFEHLAPDKTPLHSGFLKSSRQHPYAAALWIGDQQWTYRQVEEQARTWAAALRSIGERAPQRIGILAARGEIAYVGVLASLFAGAAYVPLNPTFPVERLRYMMEHAELDALIVDQVSLLQLRFLLQRSTRKPAVLLVDADDELSSDTGVQVVDKGDLEHVRPLHELPPVLPEDVAYLMFTSGSTGWPKGVPVTHASVGHFLTVNQRRYKLTPADRLSQTFELTFDLSVFDLFMAWGSAACVCLVPPLQLLSPMRLIQEKGITVWFAVPSVAAMLHRRNLLRPGTLASLRWSLFCGEALPQRIAQVWQAAAPNSRVENLYGPTELTIACSAYRWDPEQSPQHCRNGIVPIGRVYTGLHELVVDGDMELVEPGEAGELCVAGPQTFNGYWRDPEKTSERTFIKPDHNGREMRFYRTGDRVQLLDTGDYAYLGRMDSQVKIRGYRVELGEVEAALCQEPEVVQAAAFGYPVEDGSAQGLVAVISGDVLDVDALIGRLRARLPVYMIPKQIFAVGAMPLNSNGKVDRPALLDLVAASPVRQP